MIHVFVKPCLYTEKACHFCNPEPYGFCIYSQTFKPESQFMPYFICYYLTVWILKNIPYSGGLHLLIKQIQMFTTKQYASAFLSMRCQNRLKISQKRAFARTRLTTYHDKLSSFYTQVYLIESRSFFIGICEGQIFD